MKKNSTKLLIFMSFFVFGFIFMTNVKAEDNSVICKYKIDDNHSDYFYNSMSYYGTAYIKIDSNNNFKVTYKPNASISEDYKFDSGSDNILVEPYMHKDVGKKLKENLDCPKMIYLDLVAGKNACFSRIDSSDKNICEDDHWHMHWDAFGDLSYSAKNHYEEKVEDFYSSFIDKYISDSNFEMGTKGFCGIHTDNNGKTKLNEKIDIIDRINAINEEDITQKLKKETGVSDKILSHIDISKKNKNLISELNGIKKECNDLVSISDATKEEKENYNEKFNAAVDNIKSVFNDLASKLDEISKIFHTTADCEGIFGSELMGYFQKIFNIFKIIAPLLVLGLTIFDFAKAAINQDKDATTASFRFFIKRLILMIVLYFIPVILNLLFSMFENSTTICNIK